MGNRWLAAVLGTGDGLGDARRRALPAAATLAPVQVGGHRCPPHLRSCAIETGLLLGVNSTGQLGDNTTTDRSTPVAVQQEAVTFSSITANAHTCGLTGGGAACWESTGADASDGTGNCRRLSSLLRRER